MHPTFNNNILIFQENNIHTKICQVCAKQITENFNKIIEHDELKHADQNHIISSFPPLEDKNIYNTIQSLQIKKDFFIQEKFIEKINNYFISLKKEINQKIDNLQNQVKSKLIQIENSIDNQGDIFLDIYNEVSSKFDIQKLYNEYSQNSEQRIKEIIKEKYSNIKKNYEFKFADQNQIFSNFPPLEDKNINTTIQDLQIKKDSSISEIFIEKINNYFISLKKEINLKIDKLQNQVKQKLVQMEDFCQNQGNLFLDIYNQISSKFNIQRLYNEYSQNSEQHLKEIIKEKYENIKINTEKLFLKIQEYQTAFNMINLKTPIEIQQKILDLIDQIDFFEKPQKNTIDNIEFEKSKSYGASQYLQIQRLQNKQIQINQSVQNYSVSYANFILDPNKKYFFRVKLQTHSHSNSFLNVGIIKEQDKDTKQLLYGICYCESGDNMTINKVVKGNNVFEGYKANIDKEIERRIHLAQKTIKVANYPNNKNVVELQNKQLILENTLCRFAVEVVYTSHKIIITHLSTVNEFDQNM
ncbi:hypothetical protein ABPG72_014511 [Tetrahymena utriculariae]